MPVVDGLAVDIEAVASHYRSLGHGVDKDVVLVGASGSQHRAALLVEGPGGRMLVFFEANGFGPLRRIADDVGATPVVASDGFSDDERRRADALGILLLDDAAIGPAGAPRFAWLAPRGLPEDAARPAAAADVEVGLTAQTPDASTDVVEPSQPVESIVEPVELVAEPVAPTPVSLGAPPAAPPTPPPEPSQAAALELAWRPLPAAAKEEAAPAPPLAASSGPEATAAKMIADMIDHPAATAALADAPPLHVSLSDLPRSAEMTIHRVGFETRGASPWVWVVVLAGLVVVGVLLFLALR